MKEGWQQLSVAEYDVLLERVTAGGLLSNPLSEPEYAALEGALRLFRHMFVVWKEAEARQLAMNVRVKEGA